jgi:hypothetical protein
VRTVVEYARRLLFVTRVVVRMLAECGNMACEEGEECSDWLQAESRCCSVDCPVSRKACPFGAAVPVSHGVKTSSESGVPPQDSPASTTQTPCSENGVCLSASGTCRCFDGYAGYDCSECATGHMRLVAGGRCVFLPGALSSCTDGVRSAAEGGVDCGGVCDAPCYKASATWTEYRIEIFVALAAVAMAWLLTAVVIMCRAHRRQLDDLNVAASSDRKYASGGSSSWLRRMSGAGASAGTARGRTGTLHVKSAPVVPWVGEMPIAAAASAGVSLRLSQPEVEQSVRDTPSRAGSPAHRWARRFHDGTDNRRGVTDYGDWLATATPISPLSGGAGVDAMASGGGYWHGGRPRAGSADQLRLSPGHAVTLKLGQQAAPPARTLIDRSQARAPATESVTGRATATGGRRASFDARAGGRTRVSVSSAVRPDPQSVSDPAVNFGLY